MAKRHLRDIGVLTLIEHVFEFNRGSYSPRLNESIYFYFRPVIPSECKLKKDYWHKFDLPYVRECLRSLSSADDRLPDRFSGLLTVDEVKKSQRGVRYIQLDKKVMIFPGKTVMDLDESDWSKITDGIAFHFPLSYMKAMYGRRLHLVYSFALDPDGEKRGVRNLWRLP